MGDPLTVAALAAMAGGSYLQSKANRQVRSKQREYTGAETARQQQMSEQAQRIFRESLAKQTLPAQETSLDVARQARQQALTEAVPFEEGSYLPTQENAPAVIRQIMDAEAREATEKGQERAEALGRLGSYSDVALQNLFNLTRSGERAGQLGQSMRQSANILPMELAGATRKGAKSRAWGDLLTGAGQLAGLGSMAGYGGSWDSLFGGSASTGGYNPFSTRHVPKIGHQPSFYV